MLVWRSIASNALTLFVVILIGAGIVIAMGQNAWRSDGPLVEAMCLSVPRGGTIQQVSEDLAEQGAIRSAMLFRIGAEYTDRSDQLKAGNFLIPPGASPEAIVDLVTRGGQSTCGSDINLRIGVAESDIQMRELDPATGEYAVVAEYPVAEPAPAAVQSVLDAGFARTRVTLAEGVTSWQVADSLQKASFLGGEVPEVPDEGTLAPGSYDVVIGGDRGELLAEMAARQEEILTAAWAGRAEGLPLRDAYEALIMASIVEKETGVPEERALVASVFENRLNEGMRLQTDPTVIYGLTDGKGILGRGLYRSELARATPYNTYIIQGLPPTPIANPGREAIEAAVRPADTEFLFFVADGTGGHVFATTLAEHNENVQRWRQIERQQNQNPQQQNQ